VYRTARCPNPQCRLAFPVEAERLGKNLPCPGCGQVITVAPEDLAARAAAEREGASRKREPSARLPFEALLDNIRSLWNVGSIFRSADAAGLGRLHLCGITGRPPRPEIAKTALGAEEVVPFDYSPDALEAARRLAERDVNLVALERSPRSVSLGAADFKPPLCLIIGNEVAGVSAELLELAPLHVHLPMRGVKETLNAAVAFGIAAFEIARRIESSGRAASE